MRSTISSTRLLASALLTTSSFALLGLAVEGPPNHAVVPILPAVVEGPPNHGVVDAHHPPPAAAPPADTPGLLGATLDLGVTIDPNLPVTPDPVPGVVPAVVDTATDTAAGAAAPVVEAAKPALDAAAGVVDTATNVVDGALDTATSLVDGVLAGATPILQSAVASASALVEDALAAPSSVLDRAEDAASSVVSLVTSLVPLPTGTATEGLDITTATNTHSVNGTTAVSTATGVMQSAFTTIIISSIYITPTGSAGNAKPTGPDDGVVYEGGLKDPTLDKPCWSEEECAQTGSGMKGAHTVSVAPKGEEGAGAGLGVPLLGAMLAGVVGVMALL